MEADTEYGFSESRGERSRGKTIEQTDGLIGDATASKIERLGSFRTNDQQRDMQLPERHVVPHFNGFIFKHQSDKDWLGLSGNRVSEFHRCGCLL